MLKGKTIYVISTGATKSKNVKNLLDNLTKFGANCIFMPTEACCSLINLEELKNYRIKKDYSFNRCSDEEKIEEEDLVVVAPCTFNTFSKIACGIADSYPLSIIHSAIGNKKPVIIAPAMNLSYWNHPVTKSNFKLISSFDNVSIIHPELIYDECYTLDRVTMAPWEKIIDNVCHKYSKIKYDNEYIKYDMTDIINIYYPEFYSISKYLQDNQFTNGVAGFIARRIQNGILITSTGSSLGNLSRENISLIQRCENHKIIWSGKNIPSSEVPLVVEIFNEFPNDDVIIHGHCKDVTYSPKMAKYNSLEYLKYGEWDEIYKIKPLLEVYKKGILKLHGEIIIAKTFDKALSEYMSMYNESI